MHRSSLAVVAAGLLLCACAGPKDGQPRNPFGVTLGAEDGNTFSAKAAAGDAARATENAPAAAAAPLVPGRPIAPPPAPVAPVATAPAPAPAPVRIDIDANAYGAVFGTTPAPVRPTPAQLMQLDSLSLMAAESLRVDLQTRILECRRAGDNCRMGAR